MSEEISILLVAGGTAGHVNPMLSLAYFLENSDYKVKIFVLGTGSPLELRLLEKTNFAVFTIDKLVFPRRLVWSVFKFPFSLFRVVKQAGAVIDQVCADVVVGFGGYVSAPAYLAARIRKLPFVVHEANVRAGWANKLGAFFTKYVGVSFSNTKLSNARLVGLPLKPEIVNLDRLAKQFEARVALKLDPKLPVLVVTGGSSGSVYINKVILHLAGKLVNFGVQILHITGVGKNVNMEDFPGYHCLEYVDSMDMVYAAADVLICRGGAATVSEVSVVGVPAVFVPLDFGNGEQKLNVSQLVEAGGALVVSELDFTVEWVVENVIPLLHDSKRLKQMSVAALQVGVKDGAKLLADLVFSAYKGGK